MLLSPAKIIRKRAESFDGKTGKAEVPCHKMTEGTAYVTAEPKNSARCDKNAARRRIIEIEKTETERNHYDGKRKGPTDK